jgi:hypothetical protein
MREKEYQDGVNKYLRKPPQGLQYSQNKVWVSQIFAAISEVSPNIREKKPPEIYDDKRLLTLNTADLLLIMCDNHQTRWLSVLWGWMRLSRVRLRVMRMPENHHFIHFLPEGRRAQTLRGVWSMISRVQSLRYRCFNQSGVPWRRYNVQAGANGSGKHIPHGSLK